MIWVWKMISMRRRMRFEGVMVALIGRLDEEGDAEL